jgi:hypothetical protein
MINQRRMTTKQKESLAASLSHSSALSYPTVLQSAKTPEAKTSASQPAAVKPIAAQQPVQESRNTSTE